MPVFSRTLNNIAKLPESDALAAIANHLRVMQEELEHRLLHLDSTNVTEIDSDVTDILLKDGKGKNITLQDANRATQAQVSLLADSISTMVTTGEFTSYQEQTAKQFLTVVTNDRFTTYQQQTADAFKTVVATADYTGDKIASMINQSSTKIEMSALNIDLSGYVTFTSLGKDGTTAIDGSRITTGTISAARLNLTDAISFSDLKDSEDVGTVINAAYSNGATAKEDVAKLANGTYLNGTFINGKIIYSPQIYADDFIVLPQTVQMEDGEATGSYQIKALIQSKDNQQINEHVMLKIDWHWAIAPYVTFWSPAGAYAYWGFTNSTFTGNIDFSGATVTGLSGAGGGTAVFG